MSQWWIYIVTFWMCAPPGSKFFQFHPVFWENLAKFYVDTPLGSWRPYLGEILDPPLCQQIKKMGQPPLEHDVQWPGLKLRWWTQTLLRLYSTQVQVVNSNSTWAVQDPSWGGELKLYLGCTGSKLRWWTQTLLRLYRTQVQVVNSNSTSAVQDPPQVVNSNSTSAVQEPLDRRLLRRIYHIFRQYHTNVYQRWLTKA